MSEVATTEARRKTPQQDRSRALVDAIVEAAADILQKHGREAVTTNAVARRAGVSVGSLYQYFPNREAILVAVGQGHRARVAACVAETDVAAARTLEEVLDRIVAVQFAAHAIDPHLQGRLDQRDPPLAADLLEQFGSNYHGPSRNAVVTIVAAEIIDSIARIARRLEGHYPSADLHREAVFVSLDYLRARR